MPQQAFEIICALCNCHFITVTLGEEDLICQICGHSLDDDHAGSLVIIDLEAATS